jgi:hypothetical protein
MMQTLRRLFGKKQPTPMVLFGTATPAPMTDAQLRDWALKLHAQSIDPTKLPGFGIDPAILLTAQLDGQALAEVRRWSGIPSSKPERIGRL